MKSEKKQTKKVKSIKEKVILDEQEIPADIKNQVESQLQPLFSNFYASSEQYVLYKKYEDYYEYKFRKADDFFGVTYELNNFYLLEGLSKSKVDPIDQKRHLNFNYAFNYLMLVETIGTLYINQVILLLIGSGHTFHLEPDINHRYIRHAKSLEDIESPVISLASKLDFLAEHGLSFFSKWIDRQLRNRIAHLDFDIDEKGDFFIIKNKKKKINLLKKIKEFEMYSKLLDNIFYEEIYKRRKK